MFELFLTAALAMEQAPRQRVIDRRPPPCYDERCEPRYAPPREPRRDPGRRCDPGPCEPYGPQPNGQGPYEARRPRLCEAEDEVDRQWFLWRRRSLEDLDHRAALLRRDLQEMRYRLDRDEAEWYFPQRRR